MNKQQHRNISEIFQRLQQHNPNPTTELVYNSNFELLIAVVLSAQATDISVNKATKELFKKYNTPEKILKLGENNLKEYIKTIGLYNTKAKNIITACKILVEQHNSQVPENRENLEALPGVGRKTANVVLNTAFNQHTIAVDTHIFRVANRLGIANGKNILKMLITG
jgi:endonuclease-3